mgnify:CR=1 FL=1
MRALYTAATGMAAQQMRLDNIANNLANVLGQQGQLEEAARIRDIIERRKPGDDE